MMKLLLAALVLTSFAGCSPPTPLVEVEADKPDPIHAAVTAHLKQTLDDPASYQPATWGRPTAWIQTEANRLEASRLDARVNTLMDLAKVEARPAAASQSQFDKTTAAIKSLQNKQDSLLHTADTTRLGSLITHAYRAKNKMGATQLDSAQFIVYKNGRAEKL